jgi:hypothetical protein
VRERKTVKQREKSERERESLIKEGPEKNIIVRFVKIKEKEVGKK